MRFVQTSTYLQLPPRQKLNWPENKQINIHEKHDSYEVYMHLQFNTGVYHTIVFTDTFHVWDKIFKRDQNVVLIYYF